jgi:hypothetical protein
MDFTSFHTALLTMVVLERQELIDAGAIGATDHQAWMAFQNDPARWFLSAGDEASAAVWKAIWRRRALAVMVGEEPTAEIIELRRQQVGSR